MSKALKCDRCGKCFVPDEVEGLLIKFRNPTRYSAKDAKEKTYTEVGISGLSADDMLDLCPKCSVMFDLFMKGV